MVDDDGDDKEGDLIGDRDGRTAYKCQCEMQAYHLFRFDVVLPFFRAC